MHLLLTRQGLRQKNRNKKGIGYGQIHKKRQRHLTACCETSLTNLTSWLPGPVHRDFDALGVDGADGGHRPDHDHEVEALRRRKYEH